MIIAICIITYRRPEGLKRLLRALNKLTFSQSQQPDLSIIVVDNDVAGSGNLVCKNAQAELKWPLTYAIEPHRGISFARNRTLLCVPKNAEFVAFIDDDEEPDPSWLDELLAAQRRYDADAVAGPVLPRFLSDNVPFWVTKGKFFERSRYPSGHRRQTAATNNVLVRRELFRVINPIFDERFALTGGEDGYFFKRVARAGYKIVWSDEALVYEWIPESRITISWLKRRAFRVCSTFSMHEMELDGSFKTQITSLFKAVGRIVLGFLFIFSSSFLGKHVFVKGLLNISGGVGRLSGLFGKTTKEYEVVHGS